LVDLLKVGFQPK